MTLVTSFKTEITTGSTPATRSTTRRLFGTSVGTMTATGLHFTSQKMRLLLTPSGSTPSGIKRGFFCVFDFMDSTEKSEEIFGSNPTLLNKQPASGNRYEVDEAVTDH